MSSIRRVTNLRMISSRIVSDIEAAGEVQPDIAFTAGMIFAAVDTPAEGQPPLDPMRPRDFKMVAYTGGKLLLPNYDHPVVCDLQGMQWPSDRLPVRARHNKDLIATIGQTKKLVNDKKQITAEGFVSPKPVAGKHIVDMNSDGFEWQASIEAKLLAPTKLIPAGQSMMVNGQMQQGPFYYAPKTRLQGIGVVELGADSNTSTAIAADLADPTASTNGGNPTNPQGGSTMTFEQWCQAQGIDPASLTGASKQLALAIYNDQMAEGAAPMNAAAVKAALGAFTATATTQTQTQNDPNRQPVAACSLELLASICGERSEVEANAIQGGWDEIRVRREVRLADLRVARPQGRLPPVSFSTTERQIDADVIQASLLLASGMDGDEVGNSFQTLNPEMPQARREMVVNAALSPHNRIRSFSGIFRRLLGSRGLPTPDDKSELFAEMVYASQTGRLDIEAAGGNTMVNLPGIFGDYMNKLLLIAYGELPTVIPEFCQEVDANDFKTLHTFRMNGIGGEMYELGPTGELKTVQFVEESYTNRLKTRGFILTIPRELIINDDLQAMTGPDGITTLIGRNARRTRERIGFRTLLRAFAALFTVGHANLQTGGGSVLGADGAALQTAITKQIQQKDANGDPLMIPLDRLLTGSVLAPTASNLYTKDNVVISGVSDRTRFADNTVKGKLRPIASPFMDPSNGIYDTDGTTDLGSDTRWLGLCDPKLVALVQFVYLSGKRAPTVETRADASFNTLGMSWRCYWDINAASMDFRAGQGSDGV